VFIFYCLFFSLFFFSFFFFFFFSSRRRHTRSDRDWSSDGALPICPAGCVCIEVRFLGQPPPLKIKDPSGIGRKQSSRSRHRRGRSEERRVGKECRCRW